MKKGYIGHNREFVLETKHHDWPKFDLQPDQDAILEMVADLKGHLSIAANQDLIKMALNNIKEHDEISGATNFYEKTKEKLIEEWL